MRTRRRSRPAAEAWRERLAGLPRPLTAVLVGGETKPFRFDARGRRRAAGTRCASRRPATAAASISPPAGARGPTSWRRSTPGCRQGARCYRWRRGAADNPYLGLLGHADRFVVTGDSVSMMVEVASLGRPLAIFRCRSGAASPIGSGRGSRHIGTGGTARPAGRICSHRLGVAGYARDLGEIQDRLIERGLAVPLGQPFRGTAAPLQDELQPVVARIRALLA